MAEIDFERRLERIFSDSPELADAGPFAERVERRLNAGWTARRWLIGAAGVVGGVIGASQLVMSNVVQRMEAAEDSARLLSTGLSQISPGGGWLEAITAGGGAVWFASGLAVVMMGFVLSRVIGEI